ncbi:MAG: hypothetical protein ACOY2B_00130 [Pseudomonadota bacterium]
MRVTKLLLLALLLLPGCGKKGPLDAPPGGSEDVRVEREWSKDRNKDQITR